MYVNGKYLLFGYLYLAKPLTFNIKMLIKVRFILTNIRSRCNSLFTYVQIFMTRKYTVQLIDPARRVVLMLLIYLYPCWNSDLRLVISQITRLYKLNNQMKIWSVISLRLTKYFLVTNRVCKNIGGRTSYRVWEIKASTYIIFGK